MNSTLACHCQKGLSLEVRLATDDVDVAVNNYSCAIVGAPSLISSAMKLLLSLPVLD